MVEHHVIGDVDQRRDRALAGGLEPPLHPVWRAPFVTPRIGAAEEGRAAFGIFDPDRHRAGEAALDLRHGERLERADARRGEVAGDAAHAHAILPVGRDATSNTGSSSPAYCVIGGADRRIRRQLDDPAMVVAKLELARRAHHAAALDPADRRDLSVMSLPGM